MSLSAFPESKGRKLCEDITGELPQFPPGKGVLESCMVRVGLDSLLIRNLPFFRFQKSDLEEYKPRSRKIS